MSNTKRKADGHPKTMSKLRIIKSEKSRADSERDSGYSDASWEHMSTNDTTDSEDSPRSVVQQESKHPGSGTQPSQLAVVGGSYSSMSPMIIMNNVLLKQPGDNPPALKPWGFSPTMEVVQPVVQQPQVVFLQPMVSHQASAVSKEAPSRHRRSKKYLPILKSYPKIAPHPGDSSGSSGRGGTTLSSSSSSSSSPFSSSSSSSAFSSMSSSSSGSEKASSLASSHRERNHRDKSQPKAQSRGTNKSGLVTISLPATPTAVSPLLQNRPLSLPAPTANKDDGNQLCDINDSSTDPENKRKRFCNTYNILSKSGLLDITLRTKELLRQNRRTQGDLDRLKEHTNLFLQALQSGDASICGKLQASLQEEDKEREGERCSQNSLKVD